MTNHDPNSTAPKADEKRPRPAATVIPFRPRRPPPPEPDLPPPAA
jgi:hypothetical protein